MSFSLKQLPNQSVADPLKICVVGNPGTGKTELLSLFDAYLNWKCYPVLFKDNLIRKSHLFSDSLLEDEPTEKLTFNKRNRVQRKCVDTWKELQHDYSLMVEKQENVLSPAAVVVESIIETHELYDKICFQGNLITVSEYNSLSENYKRYKLPTSEDFNMVIYLQDSLKNDNLGSAIVQQKSNFVRKEGTPEILSECCHNGNTITSTDSTTAKHVLNQDSNLNISIHKDNNHDNLNDPNTMENPFQLNLVEKNRRAWLSGKTNVFVVDATRRKPLQIFGIVATLLGVSSSLPKEIQWCSGIRVLKENTLLRIGDGYIGIGCKSYYGMVKLPSTMADKDENSLKKVLQEEEYYTDNSSFGMMLRLIWQEHTERRSVLTIDEFCDMHFRESFHTRNLAVSAIGESFIVL